MYKSFFKRILDFIASLIAIIVLSPIFMLVTLLLLLNNNGSVFFFQKRPGKNEKIFNIIKFKSMTDKKDENGKLLPNEKRLTKVGKFIRKSSIDEIPQLLNVLKGDMTLVGPRPLKVEYLELYSEDQKKRHLVKPGITGWAQVNGRNAISHSKKFELDVWYVNNLSFKLDLKILYLTILKVIKREGVGEKGIEINEPFNGTN
ncbi:sugar transferase [Mesoflavibacter sp. CH_XMU1422-2]|uniref:sugar transferase n=1 Tax=Mesoflavibacter sp. CH_XMU1422-2 TaxID=3107770 RepID=UPI00300A4F83